MILYLENASILFKLDYLLCREKHKRKLIKALYFCIFVFLQECSRMYLVAKLDRSARSNWGWINKLGYAMIESCKIEVGGSKIDEQYGDWLNVWNELTRNMKKKKFCLSSALSEALQLLRKGQIRQKILYPLLNNILIPIKLVQLISLYNYIF